MGTPWKLAMKLLHVIVYSDFSCSAAWGELAWVKGIPMVKVGTGHEAHGFVMS